MARPPQVVALQVVALQVVALQVAVPQVVVPRVVVPQVVVPQVVALQVVVPQVVALQVAVPQPVVALPVVALPVVAGRPVVLNPNASSSTLMAVGGPNASEALAGGVVSSQGAKYLVTLTAGTWQVAPNNPPFLNGIRAVHAVGPNEMYLGGADGSGTPALVRARR